MAAEEEAVEVEEVEVCKHHKIIHPYCFLHDVISMYPISATSKTLKIIMALL